MLHAFNLKNVRRVLVSSRVEHANSKDEDGVTSMVFTPLAFMSAEAAASVLGEICGTALAGVFDGREPIHHEVILWPQGLRDTAWTDGAGSTRCEPDILIRFDFQVGHSVVLIGEMKWNWMVGTEHLRIETDRQRRAVRAFYPNAGQVVLTITKRLVRQRLDDTVERTWVQVHGAATALARRAPSSPAGRWGRLVADFLSRAEQMDFQGFTDELPTTDVRNPMFWRPTV